MDVSGSEKSVLQIILAGSCKIWARASPPNFASSRGSDQLLPLTLVRAVSHRWRIHQRASVKVADTVTAIQER